MEETVYNLIKKDNYLLFRRNPLSILSPLNTFIIINQEQSVDGFVRISRHTIMQNTNLIIRNLCTLPY